MLRDTESPEAGTDRFNGLSPISYGLKKADDENLPWVVLVQGDRLRLYATAVEAGVGRRGARKSSGSYYTKSFAVEHLLEGALEPALDDHFARLRAMDEADAADAFFNFRVADIAMGSGHFLIAAIDRIEKRMADAIAARPLSGVRRELNALRGSALAALGDARRRRDATSPA